MINDPRLTELVNRQTEAFNRNAPEDERVAIQKSIIEVQEIRKTEGRG